MPTVFMNTINFKDHVRRSYEPSEDRHTWGAHDKIVVVGGSDNDELRLSSD